MLRVTDLEELRDCLGSASQIVMQKSPENPVKMQVFKYIYMHLLMSERKV